MRTARPAAGPRRLAETPTDRFDALPMFELSEWHRRYGLVAGITAPGPGPSRFDLGLASPAPAAEVLSGWRRLAAAARPAFTGITVSRQVHGERIRRDYGGAEGLLLTDGFDGHVTDRPGTLLAVTVADCVPVYLAHPDSGVVALVHAGWRGIAAGIVESAVRAIREVVGREDVRLVLHAGVAICGDCYEVGAEVETCLGVPEDAVAGRIDLRSVIAARAAGAGVGDITTSDRCTFHDPEQFSSYRREGARAGRMVAFLGRPFT